MPRRPLLALALLLVLTLPSALGRVLKEPSTASSPAPAPSAGAASASGPRAAPNRMQPRIIGGTEDRSLRFFSYVARLTWTRAADDSGICTGSLIAPNVVLTAAHCVWKEQRLAQAQEVTAEIQDRQYAVTAVVPHEDYDPLLDWNGDRSEPRADIALLILESIAPSAGVVPLPAPRQSTVPAPGTHVWAAGYGRDENWELPEELRYTDLTVVTSCPPGYPDNFCAGAADGHVTCKGDSGGPVVAESSEGHQVLVGITSFGSKDCSKPYAYYTRVQDYMGWINAVMRAK